MGEDDRFSVKTYDSKFAGRTEVADSRTPLTAILEGEPEEREASAAVVVRAAERIAERIVDIMARTEGIEIDEELLADLLRKEIDGEIHEVRLITTRSFLRYLWQGARNPWDALKKLLAATRLAAKELIRGISQTEVAYVLGESKAATRAREKKGVEDFLREWGAGTVHFEGAQKSEAARATYARVQKGNRNRSKGKTPVKGSRRPKPKP
jgi:type III secretion system FlhB-like substrate exporter